MKPAFKLTPERPWRVLTHPRGKPNLVGYARVSTRDQSLAAQLTALQEALCSKVYAEKVSGGSATRAGWAACVEALRSGDTLVVLRVDRLGRRLGELVRSLEALRELGVHVRSLAEGLDTSASGGRFAFTIVAALAEKVREDIRENTRAGLAELRKQGRTLGRPTKLTAPKRAQIRHLRAQGYSLRDIAGAVGVSHGTVGHALSIDEPEDPRQLRLGASPE